MKTSFSRHLLPPSPPVFEVRVNTFSYPQCLVSVPSEHLQALGAVVTCVCICCRLLRKHQSFWSSCLTQCLQRSRYVCQISKSILRSGVPERQQCLEGIARRVLDVGGPGTHPPSLRFLTIEKANQGQMGMTVEVLKVTPVSIIPFFPDHTVLSFCLRV
jgi:hypothetical protein